MVGLLHLLPREIVQNKLKQSWNLHEENCFVAAILQVKKNLSVLKGFKFRAFEATWWVSIGFILAEGHIILRKYILPKNFKQEKWTVSLKYYYFFVNNYSRVMFNAQQIFYFSDKLNLPVNFIITCTNYNLLTIPVNFTRLRWFEVRKNKDDNIQTA